MSAHLSNPSVGFTIPVRLWTGDESEDGPRHLAAVVRFDDDPEAFSLDLRLPPDEDGTQAIVNVEWGDVEEVREFLRTQLNAWQREIAKADA